MANLQHQYLKYILTGQFLRETDQTFQIIESLEGLNTLRQVWSKIGQDLPEKDRIPATGFAIWKRVLSTGQTASLVITLPSPAIRGDVWFIGAFQTVEHIPRVFCLEQGESPEDGSPMAMLAEIQSDGRANWGSIDDVTLDGFIRTVDNIMKNLDASPITFIQMPMV